MAAKAKPPDVPPPRNRSWFVYAAVVAMLTWYFVSAVNAVAGKSNTFDEPDHLTSGYTFWKFGDFRMHAGGNLPERWAAAPLLFSNLHFPDRDQDTWLQSKLGDIGSQFLYATGNDADARLLSG